MRTLPAIAVATAALASGCGTTSTPGSQTAAPPTTKPHKRVPGSSYAGLGATSAAFVAGHDTTAPAQPTPGIAVYTVDATNSAGRVTAYEVEIPATPPFTNRERVVLLDGIDLPADAVGTNLNTNTCIVWRSATLKKLIGFEYAQGTTVTGTTTAQMQAISSPHC
jgi:hypothetical protein